MKIVRTDSELEVPVVDAALRQAGHELVLLPDGVPEDELCRHVANADLLLISTAVEKVALNFNTPEEKWLDRITLAEAKQYMAEGHFADGSMLPKIKSALEFLENGGTKVIITSPHLLRKAMMGEAGTCIYNEEA